LRNVEDLLSERGIDISHETVRFWWNRFGPIFAAEIWKKRVAHMRGYPQSRWRLDEVFVNINSKLCYYWRATVCSSPIPYTQRVAYPVDSGNSLSAHPRV